MSGQSDPTRSTFTDVAAFAIVAAVAQTAGSGGVTRVWRSAHALREHGYGCASMATTSRDLGNLHMKWQYVKSLPIAKTLTMDAKHLSLTGLSVRSC